MIPSAHAPGPLTRPPARTTAVSFANPRAMFGVVDNPKLVPAMTDADMRPRRVMDALAEPAERIGRAS